MYRLSLIIVKLAVLGFVFLFWGFQSSDSPHGRNFKMDCSDCHTTKGWKMDVNAKFSHDRATSFMLEGQHKEVDCKACHENLVFSEAPRDCFQCHSDVHEQNLGSDCNRCHTPDAWIVNNISEIHQQSRFPLVGAHMNADCYQCHKSENLLRFESLGVECVDCHMDKYTATTEPNHIESGFSIQCVDCHRVNAFEWGSGGFNHDLFPLVQGHDIPRCDKCHISGSFKNTDPTCVACHQNDFDQTKNPNHVASDFSTECTDCHTLSPEWKPAKYDHKDFPLTLGHNINDCTKCHLNNQYTNTSNVCVECHLNDYNSTQNPDHAAQSFSKDCAECHNANPGWKPATFDHSKFPLTLGHNINDCSKCHINGQYNNTSPECVDCHVDDYNNTTNPQHSQLSFSKDCQTCHNTNPGWKPATFDHSKFPLTLGHNINDCTKCHTNGNYDNTPNTCVSCHLDNYNNAKVPPHTSQIFTTQCTDCHSTNPGWKPTSFKHDPLFPIYSGEHQGEWNSCTECHTNPATYAVFSCIDCHEHNKTKMDDEHKDEKDYSYNSLSCFDCHPRGKK